MRYSFLLSLSVILFAQYSFAQTSTPAAKSTPEAKIDGPIISWGSSTHEFGDIIQGKRVEATFPFTNTGNKPLIITNVAVTCGCTTPKGWPKDPIPPGGKSEITVAFNSTGRYGQQNKVIKIVSNNKGTHNEVSFRANVLKKNN